MGPVGVLVVGVSPESKEAQQFRQGLLDVEAVEKLRFHLARRECTAHDARIALVGDRTRCRTSRWWITVRAFYP
jgi:hypothetical protein